MFLTDSTRRILVVCSLLALAAGTVASQTADYDKHAKFLQYKRYKWVTIPTSDQLDELTAGQLVGTIEVELAKVGLTKTQADDEDLYIGYQIVSEKSSAPRSVSLGGSSGSSGGSSAAAGISTNIVHSGRLVLDMYDAGSKQLVWRGVASNPIEEDAKPDKKQKHLDKAVEHLLKNYPPRKAP